ncbi:tetratricopeptide repeat protein [Paenibacillus mendelii]|uniref:Tetratricopeptide repeat protein n=1 Tax=Paenibacillus mendelii TaxID=206163 RepID=A0ABV6JGT2_9BACL|nr:tetratricopeptide repeat protein [Paenibacillus mendelii]MCQ6558005.1 tetratricopeptide repeat protein [Paenibacillus mendelii]
MNGESSMKKAYEAILNGDYELAVMRFEEAIALAPQEADYHYKCSITCARSGKWPKALHYAEQAVKLNGDHEEYHYHLQTVQAKLLSQEAEALLAMTPPDSEGAITKLRLAVHLDPLSLEALLLLGALYESLADYEQAAEFAKEAIRLDPQHSAARRLYADVTRKGRKQGQGSNRRNRRRNR